MLRREAGALKLQQSSKVPFLSLDILEFYRERGELKVSLATENGRRIREEWTSRDQESDCET